MSAFWQGKQVLVTGAGGFIGSHLVERLVAEGAFVRAFVRYNSRGDVGMLRLTPREIIQQVKIMPGDIRDANAVNTAVDGCQVVFHLAALISIPYSYQHPLEVAETNVLGTLNTLMASNKLKVERLVHTSTSEVYGTALRVPIDEGHPLQGQSPYSASKIGADKLAESFHCAYNLPVVTVRPFNTFGPRQSARAVIPAVITQALAQSVIRLGNLESTRDFTYVADTVDGFVKAAESPNVVGKTMNLGTGSEIKIGALVEKIIQITGSSATIQVDAARLRPADSEVQRLLSNNALAYARMGWTPRTSLDDGLKLTVEWIKGNLSLYRVGTYEF